MLLYIYKDAFIKSHRNPLWQASHTLPDAGLLDVVAHSMSTMRLCSQMWNGAAQYPDLT